MNEDPFGNPAGNAHGYGRGVDMGDGEYCPTDIYETVRLPDDLTLDGVETWAFILSVKHMRLPDGRYGRYLTLSHEKIDVIELLDGSGYLWVNKPSTEPMNEGGEEE